METNIDHNQSTTTTEMAHLMQLKLGTDVIARQNDKPQVIDQWNIVVPRRNRRPPNAASLSNRSTDAIQLGTRYDALLQDNQRLEADVSVGTQLQLQTSVHQATFPAKRSRPKKTPPRKQGTTMTKNQVSVRDKGKVVMTGDIMNDGRANTEVEKLTFELFPVMQTEKGLQVRGFHHLSNSAVPFSLNASEPRVPTKPDPKYTMPIQVTDTGLVPPGIVEDADQMHDAEGQLPDCNSDEVPPKPPDIDRLGEGCIIMETVD